MVEAMGVGQASWRAMASSRSRLRWQRLRSLTPRTRGCTKGIYGVYRRLYQANREVFESLGRAANR